MALLLIGGLFLTDRLLLNKRGIASFEGAVNSGTADSFYDLTELEGKDFNRGFKQALVQGLQVQRGKETLGLSWGLFLLKSENGSKVYACEKYPNMEMVLKAEGIANSGNIPTLILRGPCRASDDGQKIRSWPIPLKDLYKHVRENPMWRVPLDGREESFVISARDLYEEWPEIWNVVGLKLYNETDSLEIDGYEIISILDQPLTLDFSEQQ